ncbi:VanZ family protein [Bradyrhizobium sp. JYMT SZCCT0428]|nr:VanZ family protein [Bradyrhizobium sp. JYMT SZCCT0428]
MLVTLIAVGWLIFLVYATLSTVGSRPGLIPGAGRHEPLPIVFFERVTAYALLGFLFYFATRGRIVLACVLVVASACSLELLQILKPDRDPGAFDALQKSAGGLFGVLISRIAARLIA